MDLQCKSKEGHSMLRLGVEAKKKFLLSKGFMNVNLLLSFFLKCYNDPRCKKKKK